ncbi:hypothetical protein [Geomesophilobacter sediminis]|uniref:Uncharacterized protein n=1 Tax=Geomesophilobacter sediminis TaxID=2798584 RepID=A0A8J7M0A7_9BACT|nr:hypothetical protein [Geomesophilobacter sediminis]MBJ6724197.1 hypothetical protein [Geomesophilobacter sediminis]
MFAKVYLSRRNLITLLSKICRKGNGEETACTIIKKDNLHPKYPQTMKKLSVIAVGYGVNFTGSTLYISRQVLKNLLTDLDKRKAGEEAACVVTINEAHTSELPRTIKIYALEDEEYYGVNRFPGAVHPADAGRLLTR